LAAPCGRQPAAGTVPARFLEEPAARAVADVGAGAGAAGRPVRPGGHGATVVRGLQPAAAAQRPDARCVAAEVLPVLLAHAPGLALPREPGSPRHPGPGPGPGSARQAVVGAAAAVRLAAGAVARPASGAAEPDHARGRGSVRVRHRDPRHPELLRVPVLLLHRSP